MLIKITKDMTDSERIAAENTNNSYLNNLCAEAKTLVASIADYPVEQGTTEIDGTVWNYEKRNSGKAVCYCSCIATYLNAKILTFRSALPLEMISAPCVFLSLKTGGTGTATGENLDYEMNRTVKYSIAANGDVRVFVQDVDGGMASNTTATVDIYVIGQWK